MGLKRERHVLDVCVILCDEVFISRMENHPVWRMEYLKKIARDYRDRMCQRSFVMDHRT